MPPLFFYQLALLGLLWLCVMLHLAWPSPGPVSARCSVEPETSVKSRRKRSNAPTPFVGLTYKPPCALCAHEASHPPPPPPMRPDPMAPPTRRPRQVDTSRHFCPHATCDYRAGWGWGISVPTGILTVVHGVNSTVPPATATFPSIMDSYPILVIV
jgi:hypothetical protein